MSGTLHPQYGALPWHAEGSYICTMDGTVVATIAFQSGRDPAANWERELAIARLITAAPALAEALREIVDRDLAYFGEDGGHVIGGQIKRTSVTKARAALALLESTPSVEVT